MKVNVKTLAEKDKAKLSDSNSLAFNGQRAKRIQHIATENTGQSVQAGLNARWENPPTASPNTNLAKLTRLIAERELIVYQRVGMRSTIRDQFQEITTYFNRTTVKAAFACLFYANYYDGKTTTSGRAAQRLGINRSSIYSIITHCLKKEWAIESSKAKYHASPFFVRAWHNYVEQEIQKHTELFRISNALTEAYLTEKSGVLPIK